MRTEVAATLFETPIGACGIAWSARGVLCLQLPEGEPAATRARLLRRFVGVVEGAPPAPVQRAIDAIVALLGGAPVDLGDIELDETGVGPFQRRVYAAARRILPGSTLTYGEIAERIGDPGAARSVGQALGANPFAIIVPCHRVLAAGGRIGGFSAGGGAATKRRILAIERARVGAAPDLFSAEPPRLTPDLDTDEPRARAQAA
jgi:methylated-DNA-[protein]-cysteine S-methyltransferase